MTEISFISRSIFLFLVYFRDFQMLPRQMRMPSAHVFDTYEKQL